MAKGFKHGSGGSVLNFKVVPYATEELMKAATPKENTIGIITTTPITSWIFSATEPTEPAEGMVWIATGTPSDVAFNALKKNEILVYPSFAKQYVGGAWVDVAAKSHQGGEWVEWFSGTYLYNVYGDIEECTNVTGGWEYNSHWATTKSLTVNEKTFTVQVYNNSGIGTITPFTNNYINMSAYNKLGIEIKSMTNVGDFCFGVGNDVGTNTNFAAYSSASEIGTHYCDISSVSTMSKVKLYLASVNSKDANIVFSRLWLE